MLKTNSIKNLDGIIRRLSIILLCLFIINLIIVSIVMSDEPNKQEFRYPVICYEGQELAKVREWEKSWVGKRIDSTNLEQVKQFLPEGLVKIMMEPKKWGAEELWFEIIPYRKSELTKGFIEATKRYAPLSKLDANDFLMGWEQGLLAGLPFPHPTKGAEMAWNFDSITLGDGHINTSDAGWVDAKTGSDRNPIHSQQYLYFSGRTDVPPVPTLPNNKRSLRRANILESLDPPENRGSRLLEYKYLDPDKDDDRYHWDPKYRRVRRSTYSSRSENMGANDMCLDDDFGWSGQITRNNYRFLGRREMLAARHQNLDNLRRKKGQAFFHGQQRERIKVYLVEALNKDPNYVYSKQLWYLDPETWLFLYKEMWDRKGRLWRFADFHNQEVEGYERIKLSFVVGDNYVDVLKFTGTPNKRFKYTMGVKFPPDSFTFKAIQKLAY